MEKKKLIIAGIILLIVGSIYFLFTTQYGAKKLGGVYTINLKENKKLVNMTWKDDEMWILTRDARPTEFSEKYTFREDSKFNMIEGKVVIKEEITHK